MAYTNPYRLGDKWSPNFDYTGMLRLGSQVLERTPLSDLEQLFSSFEDVNYHTESEPLWLAIKAKREGIEEIYVRNLRSFKELCAQSLEG